MYEQHRIIFHRGVTHPGECSCGYMDYSDIGLDEHVRLARKRNLGFIDPVKIQGNPGYEWPNPGYEWPGPIHRLDLACGETKKEGFLGIDQQPFGGVDVVWDLDRYPYPFPDNSVDEVFVGHFIEHVENLVAFMEELWRIMKPGATGVLVAPFWTHCNAWRDPTHRRGIADQTLMFFNREYRERNRKGCYGIKADFDVGYSINHDPGLRPEDYPIEQWRFMMQHCVNVAFDITFTVRSRKIPNVGKEER